MIYKYFDYYSANPYQMTITPFSIILGLSILALIIAVIVRVSFLRKSKEGKHHGFGERLYNYFQFNRFFVEDIARFLHLFLFIFCTFIGIAFLCFNQVLVGLAILIGGNLANRIIFELINMFVIITRKSVQSEKHLQMIEKFYTDDYDDERCVEFDECGGCVEYDECGDYGAADGYGFEYAVDPCSGCEASSDECSTCSYKEDNCANCTETDCGDCGYSNKDTDTGENLNI